MRLPTPPSPLVSLQFSFGVAPAGKPAGDRPPAPDRRRPRRRLVAAALALCIAGGGVATCSYNLLSAEARVRALCTQITPGMPLATLQAFATDHGLGPVSLLRAGEVRERVIVEKRSYGRHGCRFEVDGEGSVVTGGEYRFVD